MPRRATNKTLSLQRAPPKWPNPPPASPGLRPFAQYRSALAACQLLPKSSARIRAILNSQHFEKLATSSTASPCLKNLALIRLWPSEASLSLPASRQL